MVQLVGGMAVASGFGQAFRRDVASVAGPSGCQDFVVAFVRLRLRNRIWHSRAHDGFELYVGWSAEAGSRVAAVGGRYFTETPWVGPGNAGAACLSGD